MGEFMRIKRGLKRITLILCIVIFNLLLEGNSAFASSDYVPKYDPRESSKITEVKNQQSLGVCWSFAGIGALETYLALNNYGNYDLSEEHLRWWATLNDNGYGWNRNSYDGAPTQVAPGYLTSYLGGVKLERDIPYECYTDALKPGNMDICKGLYNVTDLEYVDNDINKVKEAIIKYGAVATTFYKSSTYLNKEKCAYNCKTNNSYGANHNVIIVGWDDNYSKDNFKNNYKPDNNGAWLIKDSNGTSTSEGGYLWISYEDKYILDTSVNKLNYAIRNIRKTDDGSKVYEYDDYGATSNLSLKVNGNKAQKMVYANVFDFTSDYNILDKVMINTKAEGAKYSIYYGYVFGNEPVIDYNSMILLKSGIVDFKGYMTFDFDDIEIPKGKGAIVVELDGTDENINVSLGCEKDLYYTDGNLAYKANAALGESYIYSEGKVIDINKDYTDSPRNLSIKAITKKSNDTSLRSVVIGNTEYISLVDNNIINVELPSIYNGSLVNLNITSNNESSKINLQGESNFKINKEIKLSENNNQVEFSCNAVDGSSKTYKINISFSKDEINHNDIVNFLNNINTNNDYDIIKLNKYYDYMEEEEKEKISNEDLSKILSLRNNLSIKLHESNNVSVRNIPWQVSLNAKVLNNTDEKYKKISGILNGKTIISLYDVSLYDNYTNLSYNTLDDYKEVSILLNTKYENNDIYVICENKNGAIEYIPFTIKDNKVNFKVDSFKMFGIVKNNKKLSTNNKENGIGDDNSNIKVDIINEDDIIYNNKNKDISNSDVETYDDTCNYSYFILMLSSLIIAIFMYNNKIKIRKRSKNL